MFQWQQLASIQGLHVTLTDANKDGLADALLYSPGSGTSTLYANTGDGFVAQPVGAFAPLGMGVSAPLAADVVGSGNAELYCLVAGKARTVALDAAPTGLLQEADDGRGTRLQLGYARGPAAPGAYQRQTVLDTLRVRSAGYDEVAYTYGYASPRAHTAGRYLLGLPAGDGGPRAPRPTGPGTSVHSGGSARCAPRP